MSPEEVTNIIAHLKVLRTMEKSLNDLIFKHRGQKTVSELERFEGARQNILQAMVELQSVL